MFNKAVEHHANVTGWKIVRVQTLCPGKSKGVKGERGYGRLFVQAIAN